MSDLNVSSQEIEKKIKVTLTRRPPVNVLPSEWPCIAIAKHKEYDNQYEFQANRIAKWQLIVRQHERGCALVYGTYTYDSQYRGADCHNIRGGLKLAPGADLPAAIVQVAEWMGEQVGREMPDDAETFLRLANECIADLPAEDCDCDGADSAIIV